MNQENVQKNPAMTESLYISPSKELSAPFGLLPREKMEKMGPLL